jgi:hypothetical protein
MTKACLLVCAAPRYGLKGINPDRLALSPVQMKNGRSPILVDQPGWVAVLVWEVGCCPEGIRG